MIRMSTDELDFKQLVEEQIENEKMTAKLLHDSARKTDNMVIRLLLNQLALDSAKHEHMLMIILELLKSPPKEQLKCGDMEFRKIIEKHVEIEHKMQESFEKIVDETRDKHIKFILQNIISDEKKHHLIMKRVYELVCEGEKIQDEKWWDFLFRYSRLTG